MLNTKLYILQLHVILQYASQHITFTSTTRSTGTVHTSVKERLASATIWRISMN